MARPPLPCAGKLFPVLGISCELLDHRGQAGRGEVGKGDPLEESLGHDRHTFFDNESTGTSQLPYTRAVTVSLDERHHVATLVASDNQPGLSAPSQGNAQTTAAGNLFVGWGSLPYVSAFDRHGKLIFNAQYPAGVNSYRAYFLPWERGRSRGN